MKPLILGLCCAALGCADGAHGSAGAGRRAGTPSIALAEARSPALAAVPRANSDHRRVPVEHVLIISIDGLRPDLALRAYMPHLRGLCERGSFTFWAETTAEAYTLPCHVSMLTGVSSEKHGVTWNEYIEESYPNTPTLFEAAKQAGRSTAFAAGKLKFIVLAKPGTVDHYYLPADEPVSDQEVAAQGVRMIREHQPGVLFVHLPAVDVAGHDHGWGSPEQVQAIEAADQALGAVLDALHGGGSFDATAVFVTADHGGAAKGHDAGDALSHFIPWIVAGPGIRRNHDLTSQVDRKVRIEDTFATACDLLGLEPGQACEGRSILPLLLDR